ncbi:cytochrome P450 monooxygenase-like protein [Periconia macrospinosa]|uniref:Cytochrome P450 monooxygenase-like protein n=1 Tax=Periconia macrospinosa TaxID=97972 RepID=A0A2V1DKF9_9PLEO|nr:cytochrome P450 monooxygenase-like protein [Periconia macrospinosa]
MLTLGGLTPESWVVFFITLTVIAISGHVIYNAFLHPLAKVPGPFFARVSGFPSWYHAMRGRRHIWLWQQFSIYGPRVRITPNTVVFRDPTAFRDIYNNKANVQKGPFYEAWQKDEHDVNTFNTRNKKAHTLRRKMLNQSFTEKSLRASESFMIKHIDRWNELFVPESGASDAEGWGEVMNFADISDHFVFDVMGDLCFGASFNIKEPGDNPFRSIPHAIVQYMQFFYPLTRSPMLELVLWLKPRGLDKLFKIITPPNIKEYIEFVNSCVAKRLAMYHEQKTLDESDQRQDMFWFLCDAKDETGTKPAYNKSELHAEANMLIIAGTDTTSTTLAGFMFYITRNPGPYKKLVQEIRSTFASPEDIVHGPELTSCVYLRACIDESMRLSPSGPSELPRQILAGGATIMGDYYPEGTVVGAPYWASGHNEDFYGDSEVFRPERWIPDGEDNTVEQVNTLRANFHPFAQGPGSCPGKNFAIMELCLAIARTFHRFDVKRPEGDKGNTGEGDPAGEWGMRNKRIFQLGDAYISVREGPMVQFRKRSA